MCIDALHTVSSVYQNHTASRLTNQPTGNQQCFGLNGNGCEESLIYIHDRYRREGQTFCQYSKLNGFVVVGVVLCWLVDSVSCNSSSNNTVMLRIILFSVCFALLCFDRCHVCISNSSERNNVLPLESNTLYYFASSNFAK